MKVKQTQCIIGTLVNTTIIIRIVQKGEIVPHKTLAPFPPTPTADPTPCLFCTTASSDVLRSRSQ